MLTKVMPQAVSHDHFVRRHGVSWAEYERVLARRGERAGPRIVYLEGELEIMSPGYDHEIRSSFVGSLVEAYCLDRGIVLTPVGHWTIRERRVKRGAEPDECYVFGARRKRPTKPDLAIEVIWTSGGLDKLEIYRKLGVREVWVWRKGHLQAYQLRRQMYREIPRSRFLPDLDLALLSRFLVRPSLNAAVTGFRRALRRRGI
jgi:Uma2 family endonuclease